MGILSYSLNWYRLPIIKGNNRGVCSFSFLKHLFIWSFLWFKFVTSKGNNSYNYTPAPPERGEVYCFTSIRPSVRPKIFFVAFFSATIDSRNLICGHKLHIGIPYCGKRFWTHRIPTSCLPKLLIFIHIFFVIIKDN